MKRFGFRLGDKQADQELSDYMIADKASGTKLSYLIKELLRAYYRGDLDDFNRPGSPKASDEIERRMKVMQDKFRKVKFDKLANEE